MESSNLFTKGMRTMVMIDALQRVSVVAASFETKLVNGNR
jgi:hypothetical protein